MIFARSSKRRKLLMLVAILGILGATAAAFVTRRQNDGDFLTHSYPVTRKDIAHKLHLSGRIVPVSSIVITPRQSGRLVKLYVQEGNQVKKGDLLFSMQLEAAGQTELLQSRSEVRRLEIEVKELSQSLREKRPVRQLLGSASVLKEESELEKQRLQLKVAQERLRMLEHDLGLVKDHKLKRDTTNTGIVYVNAPADGIITLIDKQPGDFILGGVGSGDSAARERMAMIIADMSSLQVRTRVLEADLRYVQLGLPVIVKLDAYPEVQYHGKVTHIGGQGRVDPKAGYTYFDVDVNVEKHDPRILPEMNATIEVIFAAKANVLTLPIAAVALFPDQAFVHKPDPEQKGGYINMPIEVGVANEYEVEIISGLTEGERVLEIDFSTLNLKDAMPPAQQTAAEQGET